MTSGTQLRKVGVLYTYVDVAHFFVSVDDRTRGLCVAHNDLATAFSAVGPALARLFKANRGEDVTFSPEMSLQAFQDRFARRNREALTMPVRDPAGTVPWSMEEAA